MLVKFCFLNSLILDCTNSLACFFKIFFSFNSCKHGLVCNFFFKLSFTMDLVSIDTISNWFGLKFGDFEGMMCLMYSESMLGLFCIEILILSLVYKNLELDINLSLDNLFSSVQVLDKFIRSGMSKKIRTLIKTSIGKFISRNAPVKLESICSVLKFVVRKSMTTFSLLAHQHWISDLFYCKIGHYLISSDLYAKLNLFPFKFLASFFCSFRITRKNTEKNIGNTHIRNISIYGYVIILHHFSFLFGISFNTDDNI